MNAPAPRHTTAQKSPSAFPATSPLSSRIGRNIATEEAVIADVRAGFTPAEAVENKLRYLLRSNPIGMSHLMTARLAAHRPR
jgi:hypothetical protein